MGGKRELRRCVSLMDDKQAANEQLLSRAHVTPNHVTPFCPIAIHIEGCSDDEEDNSQSKRPEKKHVATTSTNHRTNTQRIAPFQLTVSAGECSKPSLSQCQSLQSSPQFLHVPDSSSAQSDLSALKATAVRLKLRTRTSSFLAWQARWLDKGRDPPHLPVGGEGGGPKLTAERKERINQALQWLTTELKEMQQVDQQLARQLLSLRHDMHQFRLRRSCQQHQDLLDDVHSELQEQGEMGDLLDLPSASLNDTPLQQIGVTRMNISARRFSTC